MDKETMSVLAQIHNMLCSIGVRGDDAIKMGDCLRAMRGILANPSASPDKSSGGGEE